MGYILNINLTLYSFLQLSFYNCTILIVKSLLIIMAHFEDLNLESNCARARDTKFEF